MNTINTEPSVSALLGGNGLRELHLLIRQSKLKAEKISSEGEFVRETYRKGHTNSARAGTVDGTLKAAEIFLDNMDSGIDTPEPQPFFGQNIREVIRAFKPLFRKK